MAVKYLVNNRYNSEPTWWSNFLDIEYAKVKMTEDLKDYLQRHYRVNFIVEPGYYIWLEFDTEQDYIMFVLRWS